MAGCGTGSRNYMEDFPRNLFRSDSIIQEMNIKIDFCKSKVIREKES